MLHVFTIIKLNYNKNPKQKLKNYEEEIKVYKKIKKKKRDNVIQHIINENIYIINKYNKKNK